MVDTYGTKATRNAYGDALSSLGETNPNIVVVGLDLTESTLTHTFKEKFPDRFVNLGVAEQNGMGVAAGLSLVGKIPYVSTFSVFATGRCWDQTRIAVCYSNCNVKIGATHAGIGVGPDGASHQATEDIALMRVLPRMNVLVPCDYIEAKKATIAAANIYGPVYLRLGRAPVPVITKEDTPFTIGKATVLHEGKDAAIIACGSMVYESLIAAESLAKDGISVRVINLHTIKPIDEETIINAAKECGCIVTVEEHQIMGGLGSAVAEVVVKNCSVPMELIGINNTFGESGKPEELLKKYGLKDTDIANTVAKVLKKKKTN
jgi:transketolase